jgi:hypothetical protein
MIINYLILIFKKEAEIMGMNFNSLDNMKGFAKLLSEVLIKISQVELEKR